MLVAIVVLSSASLLVERWQLGRKHKEGDAEDHCERPNADDSANSSSQSNVTVWQEEDRKHRALERRYWSEQLRTSRNLNWITGIGTVVAISSLVAVFISLYLSRQANFEDNRAWIAPGGASLSGDIAEGQVVKFLFKYNNVGKSPGTSVDVEPYIFESPATKNNQPIIDRFRGWCRTREAPKDGITVFPSSVEQNYTVKIQGGGGSKFDLGPIASGADTFIANVCIIYRTLGVTRHSSVCFFLNPRGGNPSNLSICDGAYAD